MPVCDLIWMRSTSFRLIRKGTQEPLRGTPCTIGDESYLYTSCYLPWWDEKLLDWPAEQGGFEAIFANEPSMAGFSTIVLECRQRWGLVGGGK